MALNNPSNLKLGQLGHIAGGNANSTSATSLASTCRGSAASTSMWGDFKIGSVTVTSTLVFGGDGDDKTQFGIRFKGEVGDYMDATNGDQLVEVGELTTGIDPDGDARNIEASESGSGSKYQDRIANRSANASDYEGYYNTTHGTATFSFQQTFTQKDKIRANAT